MYEDVEMEALLVFDVGAENCSVMRRGAGYEMGSGELEAGHNL